MPEVSVIIPFFQKHSTLRRCLESICFRQVEAEILVVDDGSSPPLKEDDFAGVPSFRLLRQQNTGPGAARNHGAREAKGRYLLFLDADDYLHPDFEAGMLGGIRAGREVILGGFRYLTKETDQYPYFQDEQSGSAILRSETLSRQNFRQACDFFAAGTCLIRRDIFHKTSGFFDRYKAVFGEDIYLWFQVLLLCPEIHRLHKVVVLVDDAQSELGIARKKGKPVSALALCKAGEFLTCCKTKSPNFVRSFLFEYRKEAAVRLIYEGRYGEFLGLAFRFPRLLGSFSTCSFLLKRILVNGPG